MRRLVRPVRRNAWPPVSRLAVLGLGIAGWGCGPTEVLVGDAPGVARVVAGVLGAPYELALPDTISAGPAGATLLGAPVGIAGFEDGSFYLADRVRRRVGFVSADGRLSWPVGRGVLCTLGGAPSVLPSEVCLGGPAGLALAPDGTLLIADAGAHRVFRYDPVADRVLLVLGTGAAGVAVEGQPGAGSPTDQPVAVAQGPDGAVYVAEARNGRVVRVGADGLVRLVAGTGDAGDVGDGGPARDARLANPAGLAWSGDTLYVADAGNHRIRRVIRDSIFSYAGVGAAGFRGDGRGVGEALFRSPGALAAVGSLLLVADRGNLRVRIIRVGPDSIDTFGGTGASEPGPDQLEIGRTALAGPAGLAAAGRAVFVSDSGGFVVRRVVR